MRKPMEGFTMLFVCSFLFSISRTSTTQDTITASKILRDGETLVSASGSFELGFFSPGNSKSRYLGIWYKKISTGTVVWVANRESSLSNTLGYLNITSQGILVLLNSTENIVWSSNTSRTTQDPVAELLESGNLVVKDGNDNNPENFLWQSFDYPCDTFLPGMKLGRNIVTGFDRFLSSWKSTEDPAQGQFSLRIDPSGYPQLVVQKGPAIQFRAGSWNGLRWTGTPQLIPNPIFTYEFVLDENEFYCKYELLNSSVVSRYILNPSGLGQRFTWSYTTNDWEFYSTAQMDQCENYAFCGADASCNISNSYVCACLEGFLPKSPREWSLANWSNGCVRRTPLDCGNGDGFVKHTGLKLPDTSSSWFDKAISLKECEGLCLKNCSCTAYANLDIREGGSGCLLWFNELIDIRELAQDGQDLYIRMAASELDHIEAKRQSNEKKLKGIIISSVIIATGMIVLGLIWCIRKKKFRKQGLTKQSQINHYNDECGNEDMELPVFAFTTIADATGNFSRNNKLGEGGFGPVYKGTLTEGKQIAVKRLSKISGQGLKEFKNEVSLIAKLQHRNLVKLLGYCIQEDEQILIYEYVPNRSLDSFIFDQTRSKLLNWHKRMHIIDGIARGLLYLHQDSRLRIIHRDIKASNILLDNDMNPKISDFGLARTFGGDQYEANTNRVVGTYGYMSPEYVIDGLFSVKSDVFSFGVLVLEIVSGKKNRRFCHPDHHLNLLGHAWRLWIEGRALQLIDRDDDSFNLSEVLRCIHVALLCVHKKPEDRPNMSSVVIMLGSESSLPQPKQPGFFMERNLPEADTSSSKHEPCSVNEITITMLEAR